MITSLKGQLADWKYARGNTIRFLELLSEEDLHKQLPRKTFTSIFGQIAEMAWVQRCFLKGLEAGNMDNMDWPTPAYASKEDLLAAMAQFDAQMQDMLANCDGTEEIAWYGSKKGINEFISHLQSHEMMHLGQITAFCYALGIDIPQEINKNMHLSG